MIFETPNPAFLKIDFKNKSNTIISFATLIGTFLTFLSILFILYNIIQQQNHYKNDKLLKEIKEKSILFNRLKIVQNLLDEIISHIDDSGEEMFQFSESEKKNPLKNNLMSFYTNQNYYRVIELDYESIFQSFQEFSTQKNKTKLFNNLYKRVDFYTEALNEQKAKYEYHLKDKVNRKRNFTENLRLTLDSTSNIINRYRTELSEGNRYLMNDWFKLLNSFRKKYYEYINTNKNKEADFHEISIEILQPFLNAASDLGREKGFDIGIQDLMTKFANVSKDINSLKFECEEYAKHVSKRHQNYFSEDSKSLEELKELNHEIKKMINKSCG